MYSAAFQASSLDQAALVFGELLGIMPLGGAMTAYSGKTGLALAADVLHHLALPLFSLALWQLSPYFLLTRNAMLSNLRANFVLASRARGCTERSVKYKRQGRNSLLPEVTAMERELPNSVQRDLHRDVSLIQGCDRAEPATVPWIIP
jgi:peptide/nickel transport system permease protein